MAGNPEFEVQEPMISFDKLTVKASEALRLASEEAQGRDHAEVDGIHLLHGLLVQEEGIVTPVLQKLGVAVPRIHERVQDRLSVLSTVRLTAYRSPSGLRGI